MDPVRRWQVATAVTAMAGLGLGASLLSSGTPPQEVAPIHLDVVAATSPPVISLSPLVLEGTDLVSAEVRDDQVTPPTPVSPISVDEPVPAPQQQQVEPAPGPAPAPADSPDTPDTPDTPDSADSLDSDD